MVELWDMTSATWFIYLLSENSCLQVVFLHDVLGLSKPHCDKWYDWVLWGKSISKICVSPIFTTIQWRCKLHWRTSIVSHVTHYIRLTILVYDNKNALHSGWHLFKVWIVRRYDHSGCYSSAQICTSVIKHFVYLHLYQAHIIGRPLSLLEIEWSQNESYISLSLNTEILN